MWQDERQTEAAADGEAVDRGDDRLVHLQHPQVGISPRAGAGSFHFAFSEGEILFQITAGAEGVATASENDAPDVVIGFGFLPRLVESPVKITADGVFFSGRLRRMMAIWGRAFHKCIMVVVRSCILL